MLNFEGMETIDSTIYRINSNLTIKNVIKFGKSSYENNLRKDALYSKNIRTQKYVDVSVSENVYLETSDFLVFQYTCKDENNKFNSEEVYISYPHIYRLKNKFKTVYEKFKKDISNSKKKDFDNSKLIFLKTDDNHLCLTPRYEEYKVDINELINERCIVLLFDIMEKETTNGIKDERAVRLIINKPEYYVLLNFNQFESLVMFLDEFNLLNSSQNLINFSYMTRITSALNMFPKKTNSVNVNGLVNQRITFIKEPEEIKEEENRNE